MLSNKPCVHTHSHTWRGEAGLLCGEARGKKEGACRPQLAGHLQDEETCCGLSALGADFLKERKTRFQHMDFHFINGTNPSRGGRAM